MINRNTRSRVQLETKSPYRARIFMDAMRCYNTAASVRAISYLREFDTKSKGINSRQNEYELLRELIYKSCIHDVRNAFYFNLNMYPSVAIIDIPREAEK